MTAVPAVFRTFSRRAAAATQHPTGLQEARVYVRGAYEPDTIVARAGRPLRIVFRREETARCSERVVFPAFGKSATLPPFREVAVDLEPAEPGEYEFTCELGLLRGRLVVSDGALGPAREQP
jgi:plastocyanin domain-containing protein